MTWILHACIIVWSACDFYYERSFESESTCESVKDSWLKEESDQGHIAAAYCWPKE